MYASKCISNLFDRIYKSSDNIKKILKLERKSLNFIKDIIKKIEQKPNDKHLIIKIKFTNIFKKITRI